MGVVVVDLENNATGIVGGTITNVELFTGSGDDTLVGTNAATTWTITGTNDGTLSTGFTFATAPFLSTTRSGGKTLPALSLHLKLLMGIVGRAGEAQRGSMKESVKGGLRPGWM